MLYYLKGKIISKDEDCVILESGQTGYQIFVSSTFYNSLKIGKELAIYIRQFIQNEREIKLFGFRTEEELKFFESLISVSGVGPRSAMDILSIASVPEIKKAILKQDSDFITKGHGIGKKTAERVVLELKNKIEPSFDTDGITTLKAKDEQDATQALVGLGYTIQQAREALNQVSDDITEMGQRVKEALKILGAK